MFSYKICEIFLRTTILKKIFERLLPFFSRHNIITNSGGKFGLDETSTECKVSIFFKRNNFIQSNAAILFIYNFKKSFFNISINILIKYLTLYAF